MTPVSEFSYYGGYEGALGRMVPFSCFTYDEGNRQLVAGAGIARWGCEKKIFYPTIPTSSYHPASAPPQYSIWTMDTSAGSARSWVGDTTAMGSTMGDVRDLASSYVDSIVGSRVVAATSTGIWLKSANQSWIDKGAAQYRKPGSRTCPATGLRGHRWGSSTRW